MSLKTAGMVCLSLNYTTVSIVALDALSRQGKEHTLQLDFEAVNDFGVVLDPARLGEALQEFFIAHSLPAKVRVGLPLKYLDIRLLNFPRIPEDELKQIVQDEASRESIFSYSGEPIAVAYKTVDSKTTDSGLLRQEVLAATTPQSVIESIKTTLESTDLNLLSIQPNLEGLTRFFQSKINPGTSAILLNVMAEETEFYLWADHQPRFWRQLPVGAGKSEGLAEEIRISLEHFQKRNAGGAEYSFKNVVVWGNNPALELTSGQQPDFLAKDLLADLKGLLWQEPGSMQFCFLEQAKNNGCKPKDLAKLWPYPLILLLVLNSLGVWWLNRPSTALIQSRQQLMELQRQKTDLEKLLQQEIQVHAAMEAVLAKKLQLDGLLEFLRQHVPGDLRFEKINVDLEQNSLKLEGFCLKNESVAPFVQALERLKHFKSYAMIDIRQENRSQLDVTAFSLEVKLGAVAP